jgi:GNAT superfamily N-acetyltransferase
MPSYTIQELRSEDRICVFNHLLRLDKADRYTRFCSAANDAFIHMYAYQKLDFKNGKVFGAVDENGRVIGVAMACHVESAAGHTEIEAAFSIDKENRGQGVAQQLMDAIVLYCHDHGVTRLCMECLRYNQKMRALAVRSGLEITVDAQEAYAETRFA